MSVLAAAAAAINAPSGLTVALLVITLVAVGVAIPACMALARGRVWAWWALVVLAAASIGSLPSAWTIRAWPSARPSIVLGATLGFLQDPSVRTFVGKTCRPWRGD